MNHFTNIYGKITRAQLDANQCELDNEWDPETRITTLLSDHRQVQQIAAATDPISDYTLLIKGMAAVSKTGLFTIDVELFDRRPLGEQTYENFKIAFMNADTLYHTKITTAQAGYHTANAAKQGGTPQHNKNKKLTGNPDGTW